MHYGGSLISALQELFTSINKTFILALGYHFMGIGHFPDIFLFPKLLSLKSFGNSYIPCLEVIIAHCFTCGERKNW